MQKTILIAPFLLLCACSGIAPAPVVIRPNPPPELMTPPSPWPSLPRESDKPRTPTKQTPQS